MSDYIEEFRAAMRQAGIAYDGPIHGDGKLHRFSHSGRKDDSGFYTLFPASPIAAGNFGCWSLLPPPGQNWSQKNGGQYTPQEMATFKRQWQEAARQREVDDLARHERFSKVATKYFEGLKPPAFNHLYFQQKLCVAFGPIVENNEGDLALPLQDITGKIWSYQTIDVLGDKLFMPGGRVAGCYFPVCDKPDGPLVICEGYATGATIHEATGYATFCAMNCGNLMAVAKDCREKWRDRTILIAADNDRHTKKQGEPYNPGLEKAKQAAAAIKGTIVVPEFPNPESKGSDFNDLDKEVGRESVVQAFERAYPCPLSVLSFDQISLIPTSPGDALYGDHLLDKGSNLVILGAGGVGKSRIVYQMIASAIAGREKFLTIDVHPGARNFKWLVLQVENGVERLKKEREALKKSLGHHYTRFNEFVRVLTPLREQDAFVNLDNPENVRRLQQTIEHQLPDGIIFDSLYDFGIGELSKDGDMRQTLTALTRLARHRNPKRAIVVLHHAATGVTGAQKATGYDRSSFARNSKVIYNWARAQVNIAPMSGENNDKLVVSCGKCSNGKEFHPFAINLNHETMQYEVDSEADVAAWAKEMSGGVGRSEVFSPEKVRELVGGSGVSKPGLAKAIKDECGCSTATAYRYIDRAVDKKAIRESGKLYFKNT